MGPGLDLRPQLERLDRLMLRSEGLDPAALTFAFRPLWQLDAASAAAIALQKAQATQIYAGLGLWPADVTARLVEAQLVQDGTYPNAAAVFAEGEAATEQGDSRRQGNTLDRYDPSEPRNSDGQWRLSRGPNHGLAEYGPDRPQMASADPPLKRIHPDKTYETDAKAKRAIAFWRGKSTGDIVKDLKNNKDEPLLVKPDGRVMNGNTRLKVLQERGYAIDTLPRVMQGDPFEEPFGGGGGGHIPITKPILE